MRGRRKDWLPLSMTIGLIAAATLLLRGDSVVAAQRVVERKTSETGPRGRTIERDIRIERSPGRLERDITIRRPGGTFRRETLIQNQNPSSPGRNAEGRAPLDRDIGPPTIVENNWIVPEPPSVWNSSGAINGWGWGFGGAGLGWGLPGVGLSLGAAAPPPAVIVEPVPPPLIVAPLPPPPIVLHPPRTPFHPEADALGRLKSLHDHSRRDGALTLGQMKSARAVPALIDRLRNDWSKEVRVASAWALGEIGDPKAGVPLQRASLFDHREEVRAVAAKAAEKLRPARQTAEPGASPRRRIKADSVSRRSTDVAPAVAEPPKPKTDRAKAAQGSLLDSGSPPPPPTPYVPDAVRRDSSAVSPK